MKILDVPQTGKLGLTVTYPGRTGLIRRSLVTPKNPRTGAQGAIRSNLASQAAAYRRLTDDQQEAWISAAASASTRATLGQSGPLTGLQLFVKINCANLAIGNAAVIVPLRKPQFDPLPITGLQATNANDVVSLKLTVTDSPPEGTMLWAAPPQNAGTRRPVTLRLLGTLGTETAGKVDITAQYVAEFGHPAADDRVFVACNANSNGWEGPRVSFNARVPASS